MKTPKQTPFVEKSSVSAHIGSGAQDGVAPAGLVGRQPTPQCRLLSEYTC